MPEVSIDDANKVIVAEMERRGSLNSESQSPNSKQGKIKEYKARTCSTLSVEIKSFEID